MAAPAENLLSLGHQTSDENTFPKQQQQGVKTSRAMHLQLCLQELKDRERRAQEHNEQLLQQFEKAQDSLKEMLARIVAMKTIRAPVLKHFDILQMEYEKYLEENVPRWQQQLQEKTPAAQHKRMEDSQRAYVKKTEEKQVLASTVDRAWRSQGPQKSVAPRAFPTPGTSDYVQDNSSYDLHAQSSCFTHTGRFPDFLGAPHQSHESFLFPPSAYFYPHSHLPQHLTPTFDHRQLWSRQDHTGGDLGPCAAGIPPESLGQLYTEEPPASRTPQTAEEHEMSRVPSSNGKKDGGSRSCSSADLDVKPVRLFSSAAESSETDRDSSLASREEAKKKREKRGRTQHSASERKTSTKGSNKPDVTAQSSESNASSEEGSSNAPVVSPQEGATEQTKTDEDEERQSTQEEQSSSNDECPGEKVGSQSHADSSESCDVEQEPGKNVMKTETAAEEETDDQESSSQEKSLKNPGEQEGTSEEQSSDVEEGDHDDFTRITEEEAQDRMEDQGGDEEQPNALKSKDTEIQKQGSVSSQDEDEMEQDEESSEDQGEESGDSEDIIISPQVKGSKQIQNISEEAAEDENKTQSSSEVSDEDIEDLLAPHEQTEKKDLKADEKPKVICHNMDIFQVAKENPKTDEKSDSDDNFYD